jgi:hypothetical protein
MMTVDEVLCKVEDIIDKTDHALTQKTTGVKIRDAISASLVSIARQHYKTIFYSIKNHHQYNSAFALLRPLVDATYRGIWVMIVSTDNQVERINNRTKQFASTKELSNKIDKKEGVEEIFHKRYYDNSLLLHGMTHGGMELISRQMNKGHIEPNFEDKELIALLYEATVNYCILLFYYGKHIDDEALMHLGGDLVKEITKLSS